MAVGRMVDADPLLVADLCCVVMAEDALPLVVDDPTGLQPGAIERHVERLVHGLFARVVEDAAGAAERFNKEIVDKELFAGMAFHAISP